MVLAFSKPEFELLIKKGVKIHTIRSDKHDRWKVGMKIHFWMYNPRNVSKNPYPFGIAKVSNVKKIEIFPEHDIVIINNYIFQKPFELNNIAVNDGFESWQQMKQFFKKYFIGKLIFWENCKFN